MALESWQWFIELAKQSSFTRTAEKLSISQQTLSARLAALEKELGAKLVVRKTPLALTDAGLAFLEYAVEQEEARAKMERRVGDSSEGATGILKVAVSNMRARIMAPTVIQEFRKSMPNVRVKLIEGTNEELLRLAERGEVDIVIARFDRSHPGVIARPLFEEEVVLAVHSGLLEKTLEMPRNEAAALVESKGLSVLKEMPFLLEEDDDIAGRIGHREMRKAGLKQGGIVKCESMAVLLSMAAQGLGAVFCPHTLLDSAETITSNLVRIHLQEPARYQISVGRPANADPWTAAQMFEDVIGAIYGE